MKQMNRTPALFLQAMCFLITAFEPEQIQNNSATGSVEANLCSWPWGFQTLVVKASTASDAQRVSH